MSFRENKANAQGWNRLHNFSQISSLDESKLLAKSQSWHFTQKKTKKTLHSIHDYMIGYDSQSIWKLSNIFWADFRTRIIAYNLPNNTPHLALQSVKAVLGTSTHPRPHPNALASLFCNSAHRVATTTAVSSCTSMFVYISHASPSNNAHVSLWVCCICESLGFSGLI